jgi:hypothetical protein
MKKRVEYQGRTVEGESLEFDPIREDWSLYNCADGTTIRIKVVATEIIRLEEYNPQTGEPVYLIQSQNMVRADVPEHLRKRKENLT